MPKIYFDTMIGPNDYLAAGNFKIQRPPYINTSLQELAKHGFDLWFECRFLPSEGFSKIRLRFRPPEGGGPSVNFNMTSDSVIGTDAQAISWLSRWNGRILGGPVPQRPTEEAATIWAVMNHESFLKEHIVSVPIRISETLYQDWVSVHGDHQVLEQIKGFVTDEVNKVFYGPKLEHRAIFGRRMGEPSAQPESDTIVLADGGYAQTLRLSDPDAEVILNRYFNDIRARSVKLPKPISVVEEIDVDSIREPNRDNVIDITDLLLRIDSYDGGKKVAVNAK